MTKQLSKHHFHILTAMFVLISFMLGCNEFMVVGNLSLIAQTYHESLSQISWLVATFSWTYAIATPVIALLTNRIHKYYLFISLLLVFLAGTILSSCAPSLSWLLVSRILTASVAGVIESLLSVIVFQLAQDVKQRSMAVAYIYTGFSLASVVGVPLGTIIADHWRWQDAFIMVAVITVVATITALLVLPRNLTSGTGTYKDQLVILHDYRTWIGIAFVTCAAATLYGYYTYIRPLIHQQLHFNLNQLSFILLLIGVIDIFANQTSGLIASKQGFGFHLLRPVYILNLLLLAIFMFVMQDKWLGLGLLFLLGYTVALFGSPVQVYLDLATKKYPASVLLASTLSAIFYNVGIAMASMTGGQMLKIGSLRNLGWNSFGYCLIATIFIFILTRQVRKAKQ